MNYWNNLFLNKNACVTSVKTMEECINDNKDIFIMKNKLPKPSL